MTLVSIEDLLNIEGTLILSFRPESEIPVFESGNQKRKKNDCAYDEQNGCFFLICQLLVLIAIEVGSASDDDERDDAYQDQRYRHLLLQIQIVRQLFDFSKTTMNIVQTLAVIYICASITMSVTIPCEFISSTWEPKNTFRLNEREVIVSTRYGFDMIVDDYDQTVSKSIMEKGTWNPSQIHIIARFMQPGMSALNLGPQTGLEAILIGKLIGSKGHLYLFEPYSPSYSIVKKNIYFNDLQDISRIYKVGASDVQTDQKMLVFTQNTGAAEIYSFANFPTALSKRSFDQQVIKVDLVDNIIPSDIKLDFALIDVQKMEVQALLGMKKTIERSKDLVMMVEWSYKVNSHRNQQKTIRCLNWLIGLRFKFYKYKENSGNKCEMGDFIQIQDPFSLLAVDPLDVLIISENIDPNNLK